MNSVALLLSVLKPAAAVRPAIVDLRHNPVGQRRSCAAARSNHPPFANAGRQGGLPANYTAQGDTTSSELVDTKASGGENGSASSEAHLNTIAKVVAAAIFCCLACGFVFPQEHPQSSLDVATVEGKASKGDVAAMVQLGNAYWGGNGVAVDVDKGGFWLGRAAEKGSGEAQMLLGAAHLSGTKLPKNPQLAAKYLLAVAQRQQVDDGLKSSWALAQYWISMMYEQGVGLEKSHEKAIRFLQMAASNGNCPAQYDLGSLYNQGAGGITVDKARACELFEKAAEQGHVMAMHNTGYCYQLGIGGKTDENKAIRYYTNAAEAGSARSQHNLGMLYGRAGQPEKAYFWLRVAESSGYAESKSIIDKLKPTLPATQVEAAEKEVAAWLNAHPRQKQ